MGRAVHFWSNSLSISLAHFLKQIQDLKITPNKNHEKEAQNSLWCCWPSYTKLIHSQSNQLISLNILQTHKITSGENFLGISWQIFFSQIKDQRHHPGFTLKKAKSGSTTAIFLQPENMGMQYVFLHVLRFSIHEYPCEGKFWVTCCVTLQGKRISIVHHA